MRKLTILVTTVNAVGHVNACAGALSVLLRRGHRVIFVLEEAFKGKLKHLGYEEVHYTIGKSADTTNPGEWLSKLLLENRVIGDYTPLEKLHSMVDVFVCENNFKEIIQADQVIQESIDKFHPDLIYFDGGILFPSVYYSKIPWIKNISCTPTIFIFNGEVPPSCLGKLIM